MGAKHNQSTAMMLQIVDDQEVSINRELTKIPVIQQKPGPNIHRVASRGNPAAGIVFPMNPHIDDRGTVAGADINIMIPHERHHYVKITITNVNPTFHFLKLFVGISSTFTLDITNGAAITSITFDPVLTNGPILLLGNTERNILTITAHRTATEERYEVISSSGGGAAIPDGTIENEHLEWDDTANTWNAVTSNTFGTTGPFASSGFMRFANDQIMLSQRNAGDSSNLEFKVTALDEFDFTNSLDASVVDLVIRAQQTPQPNAKFIIRQNPDDGASGDITTFSYPESILFNRTASGIQLTLGPTNASFGVDIDMIGADIFAVDRLLFDVIAGTPLGAADTGISGGTGGIIHNVVSGAAHSFFVNAAAVSSLIISETGVIAQTIIGAETSDSLGVSAAPWANVFSNIFTSGAGTPAATGVIRLGNTETMEWDLVGAGTGKLSINASDDFVFDINGTPKLTLSNANLTLTGVDLDMNTFDIFDVDIVQFALGGASLLSTDVGFDANINGGITTNILNNIGGNWQVTEEGSTRLIYDTDNNVFRIEEVAPSLSLFETGTSTQFTISKITGRTDISDPTEIQFQIAVTDIFEVLSTGITMADNKFIANVDQIGFRITGNFVEDDASGLRLITVPTDFVMMGDGTDTFMTVQNTHFAIGLRYWQLGSIASPGVTGSNTLGRVFMDSGNSNHLSIIRNASVIDLEGAGGVSFPLTPDINARGNVTGTVTVDLSLTTAHYQEMRLIGNITFVFSNPPADNKEISFILDIVQDGVGGRTVTWPTSVRVEPTVGSGINDRTIVVVTTVDNGVNYDALIVTGGTINAANKQLSNLGTTSINAVFLPNADSSLDFGSATLRWLNGHFDNLLLDDTGEIRWGGSTDRRITNSTAGFIFEVEATDVFDWEIAGTGLEMRLTASALNLQNNKLDGINPNTITDFTTVTGVAGDFVWIIDATDGLSKKVDAADFLGGGGEVFTWTADHDTGGNTLTFTNDTTPPADTIAKIWLENDDMTFNVSDLDVFNWEINGGLEMRLGASALNIQNNDLVLGTGSLEFSSGVTISQVTADIEYDVNAGNTHRWRESNITVMELFVGQLETEAIYIQMKSITEPTATASSNIGKLFMDSGNSDHLSIRRNGASVDLETGGGADTDLGNLIATSINQDLIANITGARNLGSSALKWAGVFAGSFNLDTGQDFRANGVNSELRVNTGNDILFTEGSTTWLRMDGGTNSSTFTRDIHLTAGEAIRADSVTEIGYFVSNITTNPGAEGSIELPFTTTASPTDTALNTAFGAFDGAHGMSGSAASIPILEVRLNGVWKHLPMSTSRASAFDYTITGGGTPDRILDTGATLSEVAETLATVIQDLQTLGFFS